MLDSKEVAKQMTNEQITNILLELGSKQPIYNPRRENELIFTSVCHQDTSKYKLYCYKNEECHSFFCYVCQQHFSNIFELIMHVKRVEFGEAFSYVISSVGIGFSSKAREGYGTVHAIDDWEYLKKYRTYKSPKPNLKIFDEKILKIFNPIYHESWVKDFISIESMEKFGISFSIPHNQIIIPHRNAGGGLIGIRARNLDEKAVARGFKYMPVKIQDIEYSHPLSYSLYGLYENKETIKRIKKVCIFESEKSVLQLQSYYGNNNWSVACCGSSVSNYQRDLLISLGISEVILCFDRDWEDRSYECAKRELFERKIMNIANKFTPYVNVFVVDFGMEEKLELKDSPSDRGKEVFEFLLKNKSVIGTKIEK